MKRPGITIGTKAKSIMDMLAEQVILNRRQFRNEGGAQITDLPADKLDPTFTSSIDAVINEAAAKARTFFAEPSPPYTVGDLYFDSGGLIKRCTTARASGSYVAGDWTLWAVTADYIKANVAIESPSITGGTYATGESGVNRVVISQHGPVGTLLFEHASIGKEASITHANGILYLTADAVAISAAVMPTMHNVGGGGEPAFENSWVNSGGDYGVARFWKDTATNLVHLSGHIKSGNINTVAFTLPTGYRPGKNKNFCTSVDGPRYSRTTVLAAGGGVRCVTSDGAATSIYYSLDGITFLAEA